MTSINLMARNNYNTRFAPAGAKKAYIAEIVGRDPKMTFSRNFRGDDFAVTEPGLYEIRDTNKHGSASDTYALIIANGDSLAQITIEKADAQKIAKTLDDRQASVSEIVEYVPASPLTEAREYLNRLIVSQAEDIAAGDGRKRAPKWMSAHVAVGSDLYVDRAIVVAERAKRIAEYTVKISEMVAANIQEGAKAPTWRIASVKEKEKAISAMSADAAINKCWDILASLDTKARKDVLVALKAKCS